MSKLRGCLNAIELIPLIIISSVFKHSLTCLPILIGFILAIFSELGLTIFWVRGFGEEDGAVGRSGEGVEEAWMQCTSAELNKDLMSMETWARVGT